MTRKLLSQVRLDQWSLACDRCGHGGIPGCKKHGIVSWEVLGDPPQCCACCHSRAWDVPPGSVKRGPRPKKK